MESFNWRKPIKYNAANGLTSPLIPHKPIVEVWTCKSIIDYFKPISKGKKKLKQLIWRPIPERKQEKP